MLTRILAFLPVLFVIGCQPSPSKLKTPMTPVAPNRISELLGGEQALACVENASTVSAYRVTSPSEYHELIDGYTMAAGPIPTTGVQGEQLRSVLLNESTYGWDFSKGCKPDYGVRFQFQRDSEQVDVLLCFQCDTLAVYLNGRSVGGEDFDAGRAQLVAIVKSLFPDDDVIQSLEPES